VPIVIAASGERTQQLCGRIGDVALISASPAELPAAVAAVRTGEAAAGRPAGACRILLWTTVSVDPDRERARAAVRGSVARRALNTLARPARAGTLDEPEAAALARLQQAHAAGQHDEAAVAELVPEAWIDRFAIAGTPDEVRGRLEAAVADGADEIAMILMGPGPGQRGTAEQLTRFAESVLRPMRAVPSAALLGRSTAVAQPAQAEPREERQ
jgi:5,10-methylenetetrahydromethanopterin reductase